MRIKIIIFSIIRNCMHCLWNKLYIKIQDKCSIKVFKTYTYKKATYLVIYYVKLCRVWVSHYLDINTSALQTSHVISNLAIPQIWIQIPLQKVNQRRQIRYIRFDNAVYPDREESIRTYSVVVTNTDHLFVDVVCCETDGLHYSGGCHGEDKTLESWYGCVVGQDCAHGELCWDSDLLLGVPAEPLAFVIDKAVQVGLCYRSHCLGKDSR